MQSQGMRSHRVRIERRASITDDYGNTRAEWSPVVERWVAVKLTPRGSERSEAGGIASGEVWSITMLRDVETIGVLTEDRAVFVAGPHYGSVGAIIAKRATNDAREIIIDVEIGAAT